MLNLFPQPLENQLGNILISKSILNRDDLENAAETFGRKFHAKFISVRPDILIVKSRRFCNITWLHISVDVSSCVITTLASLYNFTGTNLPPHLTFGSLYQKVYCSNAIHIVNFYFR